MLLQEKIGKEGIRRTMKENCADRLAFIKLAWPQSLVVEGLWPHYNFIGKQLFVKFKIKEHDPHCEVFLGWFVL